MWGTNISEWSNSFCGWGMSPGHGPWFLGWLFPLLFWGLIIYLLFDIIKGLFIGNHLDQKDSALEILRNSFAAGEIDEKEYNARKRVLKKN